MEYFAGLDVSMAETQICVVAQSGAVIHKAKVPSTAADIAAELARLPDCRRIVFETGRMAPICITVCADSDCQWSTSRAAKRTRP